ncbi:MFS transporter [Neiella marina]|uniref:MFS transporter n=1 Tax=Neiella marina TaxID=508461 RepID=A0A8J2U8I9_9GAMM|nr:oligosaccharide MFS transporter [Neiella marina]GGA85573.1 MFS transporter [Neiella marina]
MSVDSNKVAMGKACLMYFFYNFFWSLTSGSLFAVWLDDRVGIDGAQIGILFGFQTGLAILFKPFFGYILDKLGLKKHLIYFIALSALMIGPFYLYVYAPLLANDSTFIYGVIIGSLYLGMLFQAGSGVVASYCDRFARCHGFDFGLVNGFGIASWGVSALLAGVLYNVNPDLMFYAASVSAFIMLAFCWSLKVSHLDDVENEVLSQEKIAPKDVIKLAKNPKMWAFMTYAATISVVFWTSTTQFTRYFISFFETQEAGIAFSSTMDGICSVFLFFVSASVPFLINRIGAKGSLIVTAAGITSFMFMMGIAGLGEQNLYLAIAGKLLFGVANPLLMVSVFAYVAEQFDKKVNSFTYMFGFQVVNNLFTAIASPVMGNMYDVHGFAMSYIYFGLFSLAATLVACFTLSSKSKAVEPEPEQQPETAAA